MVSYCLSIIVIATIVVYSNSLGNDFIVDDFLFIVDWPLIQGWGNWGDFFGAHNQPAGEEGVYSPLKTCFHALNYNLWGLNVFWHHLAGLIIHLVGTIFAYKIALRLTSGVIVSLLCGLFFGIHPVHVEAITPPTGSIDTSGVVWFFISFYFYTKVHEARKGWDKNYFFSVVFALFAIFTHELVITLPLFLLFYELCFNRKKLRYGELILKTLPFFIFSFIYAVLKITLTGSLARGKYLYDSFYLTMLVVIKALAKYVLILFYPSVLTSNHEISKGIFSVNWEYFDKAEVLAQSIFDVQVIFSLLFTALIILFAVKMWRKKPVVSFCIGWFYISLLPVLNFIPTECYFTERYLYPGSLGFCLALALLLSYLYGKKIFRFVSIILFVFFITFFSAKTLMRNAQLKNELTLYQAEVKANPRHPIMHRTLGVMYLRNNQPKKALYHLERVIELSPKDPDAFFALAESYMSLNNFTLALKNYKIAIDHDPEFAESYYNLAGLYAFIGKIDDAEASLAKAIELYKKQGRNSQAKEARKAFYNYWGF